MRKGRTETNGKAHGTIPFPRCIGHQGFAVLQLNKKGIVFELTPACEEVFNHFKNIISAPPVSKPRNGEALYLYLAVIEEALEIVLVREEGKIQQPVYFVSKALQGAELRYSKLEKLVYALLTSFRRL
ncbi:uncharacterized protein [Arachis hypogaea]|uniref:uncharacterized protein n=1 Tax=Arachis hypogaea TaxID=3818 RepID=UPI003B21CBEF